MKKRASFYRKKTRRINRGQTAFLILMMFVPVMMGIVYDIYLKGSTIKMMFSDQFGTGFGFYWIKWAFGEAIKKGSQTNSAIKVVFSVLLVFNFIGIPCQIVISYFFAKKVPGTNVFRTLFYIPSMISPVITTLVFGFMFDNTLGPLVPLLKSLGVEIPLQGLLFSEKTGMLMIYIYIFWLTVGTAAFMLTAAMMKIPPEIIEAARLDGVTSWKELTRIYIPMVSPTLSVLILANVTAGFSLYTEVLMLTDPLQSNIYTVGYLLNEGTLKGRYFEVAGRGFVFTVLAIPMVILVRWFFDRILPDVSC